MIEITSNKNKIITHIRKLESSSYRKKTGEFIIEGERLVNDAAANGVTLCLLVVSNSYKGSIPSCDNVYKLTDKLFDEIKLTVNSQGILAVCRMFDLDFEESFLSKDFLVYLDGIQDPGNMGTIIRTCDAAGVGGIILSPYCADVFNPKVVRSTMASLFNVDMAVCDKEILHTLKENGFTVYATSLNESISYYDGDFTGKTVIVIGNEANGVRDEVLKLSDYNIKIPMVGKAESLNAAVATGITLYEVLRQRRDK